LHPTSPKTKIFVRTYNIGHVRKTACFKSSCAEGRFDSLISKHLKVKSRIAGPREEGMCGPVVELAI